MNPAMAASAERHQLFQQLAEDPALAEQMGQVFLLLAQGQEKARRAELEDIAEEFASGHTAFLEALRNSERFRPWELELMEVGLATRRLTGIYRLLAEHYQQRMELEARVRHGARLPATLVLALGVGLPLAAALSQRLPWPSALGLMLLPALLLIASAAVWRALAPRIRIWSRRLPRDEQRCLLFGGVALAVEAGVGLPQALKLVARRLPEGSVRQQATALASAVARGERLSEALPASGLLTGLVLELPRPGAGPDAAPGLLARAAREARNRHAAWLARWLPWLLSAWLPLLLVLNGLALAG